MTGTFHGLWQQVAPRIHQLPLRWLGSLINVWLIQEGDEWTLIDCGLPGCGQVLQRLVEDHIGAPPARILITHGHIDHIGGLEHLVETWQIPVFAHPNEHAYLSGDRLYRSIRPAGWRHRILARGLPRGTFRGELRAIDEGEQIAGLQVLHVPGHSPGMLALWNAETRVCIAADTFRFKPIGAMPIVTYDRELARQSMRKLLDLGPRILLTSHGKARRLSQ